MKRIFFSKLPSKTVWFSFLAAGLSGWGLATAFPPFQSDGASAWFALVPFFWVVRHSAPKRVFWLGWFCGIVFWITTLAWFPAIIKNNGPWFLVLIGWAGLATWCALFFGAFAFASAKVWGWAGNCPGWKRLTAVLLADPLLWTGAEWIRSWLFTGFAWNFLGVSQAHNVPIIQIASVAGVYGVSALIVWANGALTSLAERMILPIWLRARGKTVPTFSVGVRLLKNLESILPLLVILSWWGWGGARVNQWRRRVPSADEAWRIALIQPNAPCIFASESERLRQQFIQLREQTRFTNLTHPDLTVWPETATPGSVPDHAPTMRFIRESIGTNGAPLLTGTVEEERVVPSYSAPSGFRTYNAAWLFGSDAKPLGRYRKQHLVPFGEYIPFDKAIPLFQRLVPTGASCTPGTDAGILTLTNANHRTALRLGPLICFEDTIPRLSRQAVRAGANILALMTNDAWFNRSCEPLQHERQSIFRAVENGVPMIRAANSGVTCAVNPVGQIQRLEADGQATDFHGFLTVRTIVRSCPLLAPYIRLGDWVLSIPGGCLLLVFLLPRRIWAAKRRRTSQHEKRIKLC